MNHRYKQFLLALPLALLAAACGNGGAASGGAVVSPTPTPSPTPSPAPTPTPTAAASGAVFALMDPGDNAATFQVYLAKGDVAGLAWRATWAMVEPADGAWDWTRLDAALDAASSAGKRVTIHIGASGGGWPTWLTAAGARTYSGTTVVGTTVTDPVPWDNVFLARYDRLVRQLAGHIAGRGQTALVEAVSVGAPVSEMSLVACSAGTLGTGATSTPYSRAQYLTAWTSSANSLLSAFPGKTVVVSAPVAQICAPDGDGAAFYSELMTPLSGASVFAADLNALGSQRYAQVAASLRSRPLLLQTIWSSTNDPTNRMQGTLSSAVCAGRTLGARYFELYKSDLDSSDAALVNAVRQARGTVACP
jgi:hypothetical protein